MTAFPSLRRYTEAEYLALEECVLIDQYTPRVEHNWKGADDIWMFQEIAGLDGVVELRAISVVLSLRDLYARVEFNASD
ncbi:MAG: hypothetical protein ACUVR3_01910 [Candidatus Roseilinea sp.]|uniref:hypothetical protein n=1 Tax=Candidatus Roseilinea sp. TaxID=2838777 RepID=UPI00404A0962